MNIIEIQTNVMCLSLYRKLYNSFYCEVAIFNQDGLFLGNVKIGNMHKKIGPAMRNMIYF